RGRRHPAGRSRQAPCCRVRSRREEGVRLRARLAARRSPALGQPLFVARADGFSVDAAAADVAHDGEGRGAAVLAGIFAKQDRVTSLPVACLTLLARNAGTAAGLVLSTSGLSNT